jgi:hypothetical protein
MSLCILPKLDQTLEIVARTPAAPTALRIVLVMFSGSSNTILPNPKDISGGPSSDRGLCQGIREFGSSLPRRGLI